MAVIGIISGPVAYGKRAAPKSVSPVISGKIEYRAPRDHMGCVEAWQGKQLIWRRQIYVVKYDLDLEGDVQDVFITTMERKGKTLIVKNERDSEYHLDLESLEVKVTKGSLIETTEIRRANKPLKATSQ